MRLHHFTDRAGYNAIRSQVVWTFKAHHQRAEHLQDGAYFTNLWVDAPLFFARTRVPKHKQPFQFSFDDIGDLTPFEGDRGRYVFFSPTDYNVSNVGRNRGHGPTSDGDVVDGSGAEQ